MRALLSVTSSPAFSLRCAQRRSSSSGRKGKANGNARTTNAVLGNNDGSSPSSSTLSSSSSSKTRMTTTISRVLVPNRKQQQKQQIQYRLKATRDDGDDVPFGYTRLDVMLIGGGVTGLGFAAYYGLQEFAGFDAQWAGNVVQLTFVMLLTLLWVGSYIQRVFNKDMTYGKQLKDYEEAVMQKRLEEMPESELMALMDESERAKNEK
ncbi:unnamed protein product [Bathycoccus prasinos]